MLFSGKALQRRQQVLVKIGETVSPEIQNRAALVKIVNFSLF